MFSLLVAVVNDLGAWATACTANHDGTFWEEPVT